MSAIYINWGTKVITVPKDYMQLVQTTPTEIRQLDINQFRLDLKDLEDSVAGIPMLDTHSHVQPITVGGVQLARVVEIINGYTVTFEDGQYAVNLIGANSNIGDRVNVNQVSVRSANSAGLTFSEEVENQSFVLGRVFIDPDRGLPGSQFPQGTPHRPIDNFADAKLVADQRNYYKYQLEGSLVLTESDDIDDTDWFGNDLVQSSIQLAGTPTEDCVFNDMEISGAFNGRVVLNNCRTSNVTQFSGVMRRCEFSDTVQIDANNTARITLTDCQSSVPGTSTPVLDWNNAACDGEIRKYAGGIRLLNFTQPGQSFSFDIVSGHVVIDESCTEGTIVVRGSAKITDNTLANSNIVVDTSGLVYPESAYRGELCYDEFSENSGDRYPNGTSVFPVNNLTDLETLSSFYNIDVFKVSGTLNIDNSVPVTHQNHLYIGSKSVLSSSVNVQSSYDISGTGFEKLILTGNVCANIAPLTSINCILNNVYGYWGGIQTSAIQGTIQVKGPQLFGQQILFSENPTIDMSNVCTSFFGSCDGGSFRIKNTPANAIVQLTLSGNEVFIDAQNSSNATYEFDGIGTVINESNADVITQHLIYPAASYNGRLYYDSSSTNNGNLFPFGVSTLPVNNYNTLNQLIDRYNINDIIVTGLIDIPASANIASTVWTGDSVSIGEITLNGADNTNAVFNRITIGGTLNGPVSINDSKVETLVDFEGIIKSSELESTITMSANSTRTSHAFELTIASDDIPVIDWNGIEANGDVRGHLGPIELRNFNKPGYKFSFDVPSGHVILDSSCTEGIIEVRGSGRFTNNTLANSNVVIDTSGLIFPEAAYGGIVYYDASSPYSGNVYPTGTPLFSVNNHSDMHDIGIKYNLSRYSITGINSFPLGHNHQYDSFIGSKSAINDILAFGGPDMSGAGIDQLTITGLITASAPLTVQNSILNDMSGIYGVILDSVISGNLVIGGAYTDMKAVSFASTPNIDMNYECFALRGVIDGGDARIKNVPTGGIVDLTIQGSLIIIDSSANTGSIINVSGYGNVVNESNATVNTNDLLPVSDIKLIPNAVWNVDSSTATANTFGASLSTIETNTANLANLDVNVDSANIANAVWQTDVSGYGSGTAGATLSSAASGNVDYDTLASSVWEVDPSTGFAANSVATTISTINDNTVRILGLSQQNFRYTDQVYDSDGRLLSGNISIYSNSSDVDSQSNAISKYQVSSFYDVNGNLIDYRVKLV